MNGTADTAAARTCLVTGHLLPWTGGPVRSIGAFQRALDASVVSFVEHRDLQHHALPLPPNRLALVACRRLPGARHFLWPHRSGLSAALALMGSAALVSCHSFYNFHPAWVESVCRRRGIPYWLVPHGIFDPYVGGRNRVVKQLYMTLVGRRCLANAAATVFSSRNERDKALRTLRVGNPVVINWPVDFPAICDRDAARAALRTRLGIPPESNVLLSLGRLHPMKRPIETIRLFAASMDRSWHMLLVGHPDGVSEEQCRRAAKASDVNQRVHVIPGLPATAVQTVIQGCDLYVSYSIRENFNNAAAECLANGIPILLTPGNDLIADIGPSPAIGVLSDCATESVETFNRWAAMGSAERHARGTAGRDLARAKLSFDLFRERLLELQNATRTLHH